MVPLSTPTAQYKNPSAGSAKVNEYNPLWELFDRSNPGYSTSPVERLAHQAPDPYREEKTGYQGWKARVPVPSGGR